MRGIVYEGSTKREEKQIHHDKEETGGNDILLRIAQRLASQVLLHHILIKSGHRDCNKSPRDYLFPIEFWVVEIGFPNTGIAFGGTGAKQFWNTDIQVFQNDHHRSYGSEEQEGGLQCIGPHHGLQSATESVEQNEGYEHHRGNPERDAPGTEHELIKHKDNQIHAQCRAQKTGKYEEYGACLFRRAAEALVEVRIDRCEIQLVIERQEEKSDDKITDDVAEHKGHISEGTIIYTSRNRHECHARQRSTEHTISHYKPRRFATGTKESIIA